MDGCTQKPRTPLGRPRPDTRGSPLAPLSEDWTKDGSGPRAGARGQHLLCQKGQTSGWSHHEVPEWRWRWLWQCWWQQFSWLYCLLGCGLCWGVSKLGCIHFLSPFCEIGTVMIPALWIRKKRNREVKNVSSVQLTQLGIEKAAAVPCPPLV